MTDKYTREQKIERLRELSPFTAAHPYTGFGEWIQWAENFESREAFHKSVNTGAETKERTEHAQATWDVHTGLAFTKLYRALK